MSRERCGVKFRRASSESRALLEGVLEDEVTTHVRADRYERTRGRQGHRNGHYTRDLVTTHGPLPKLHVPRLLEGGVEFTLFDKYQRRQAAVDAAIGQLFLQGISTRKLKAITRDLFGAPVSATTVSRTAALPRCRGRSDSGALCGIGH